MLMCERIKIRVVAHREASKSLVPAVLGEVLSKK